MNLALANRPRLIQPGLPRFEPGVERYRIAGGGAVVLALFAGDRLEIIDLEGRQRAELAVFAHAGEEDAAARWRPSRSVISRRSPAKRASTTAPPPAMR